jgi:hypothetical protein
MPTNRLDAKRRQPTSADSVPKKILPEVKFTGQQPGEEGVEKTEETPKREPDPDRIQKKHREEDREEPFDKQGLPIGEPPTEGKYSI